MSLAKPELKNRKMRWRSEKPPSLLAKIENERLNWRKPTHHTRHQNRKTEAFKREKRKTELFSLVLIFICF